MKLFFFFFALLLPIHTFAFSEGFKQNISEMQRKVLLKGQSLTLTQVKSVWDRFDDEIMGLLSSQKTEEELNQQGRWTELSVTEKYGKEIEVITLGALEAKFFKLDREGKTWLVSLYQGVGSQPYGTFHIFQERDGKFARVAAMEEVSGPWDTAKTLHSTIQIQMVGNTGGKPQFNSYHMPPLRGGKSNRSQIVWEYGQQLKPLYFVPEVDWHTEDEKVVEGRGPALKVH